MRTIAQVREDVQRSIDSANKAAKDAQAEAVREMSNGYGQLTTYTAEKILSAQKTANLWNNVAKALEFNDKQERPASLVELLGMIKTETEEAMIRYTPARSTNLLTVLEDHLGQEARVEFHRDIRWLIKDAIKAEDAEDAAETARVLAEAADQDA